MSASSRRRLLMLSNSGLRLFADGEPGVKWTTNVTAAANSTEMYIYENAVLFSSKQDYSAAHVQYTNSAGQTNMRIQATSTTATTRSNYTQCAALVSEPIDLTGYTQLTFKGSYNIEKACDSGKVVSMGLALVPDNNRKIHTAGYGGSFQGSIVAAGVLKRAYGCVVGGNPFDYVIDVSDVSGEYVVCPFVLAKNMSITTILTVTEIILS